MSLDLIIEEIKKKYSCVEVELYPLAIRLAGYCKTNIADFTAFSTDFTTLYCDNVKTHAIDAEALPNAIIRSSKHEEKRVLILPQAKICLNLAIKLKYYIRKTWAKNLWNIKYNEAGLSVYRKASKGNWEVLAVMLNNNKIFITDNSAALIAKGMPADFGTNFNTQLGALRPLIMSFVEAENEAKIARNTKVTANNNLWLEVTNIAEAGKLIYINDPGKRDLFTISTQLELISGAGSHWRNFTIDINSFMTVERVVRNSYFINTGNVAVMICEGNSKCTTGITVEPGETIKLAFEDTTITVNNLSDVNKAKFMCRCMKS